ncbi:MAG: hypothetical protein F4213_21005 [Boseongicola sp. SB0677_bin_26]|nr:hypothetical protein [Boseongicola sp. SB0677_bin_26]
MIHEIGQVRPRLARAARGQCMTGGLPERVGRRNREPEIRRGRPECLSACRGGVLEWRQVDDAVDSSGII